MNFFQVSKEQEKRLSQTEMNILEYVQSNLHVISSMNIRELALACFVSTATVFRFVKKLGYLGYRDFQSALKKAEDKVNSKGSFSTKNLNDYREEYLNNVTRSVQMIQNDQSDIFCHILGRYPRIFILASGLSAEIANYAYQILTICGFLVEFPKEQYQVEAIARKMKRDDVVLVFSHSGNSQEVLEKIDTIFMIATPVIISFTKGEKNEIRSMSDLNFDFFSEQREFNHLDITSRCSMLAVFEVLVYQTIARNGIH
jgi:RpiR family transcriptional regulator, glv operon transcriptional regulator